jgi:hypothetical protein
VVVVEATARPDSQLARGFSLQTRKYHRGGELFGDEETKEMN